MDRVETVKVFDRKQRGGIKQRIVDAHELKTVDELPCTADCGWPGPRDRPTAVGHLARAATLDLTKVTTRLLPELAHGNDLHVVFIAHRSSPLGFGASAALAPGLEAIPQRSARPSVPASRWPRASLHPGRGLACVRHGRRLRGGLSWRRQNRGGYRRK